MLLIDLRPFQKQVDEPHGARGSSPERMWWSYFEPLRHPKIAENLELVVL